MRILITGGAGYIGSNTSRLFHERGYKIEVLDNLSTGNDWAIKHFKHHNVDILDKNSLRRVFVDNKFDAVIHFAGKSIVAESIKKPDYYYENNVVGTKNILELMKTCGIRFIVFSSSAAIFGNPTKNIIDEDHQKKPINPYGANKLEIENMLEKFSSKYDIKFCSLRYFNAAGADVKGDLGESRPKESHLIPNIINAALRNETIEIYGDNYDTEDGTCIRDYIHVSDLAKAHLLGLQKIQKTKENLFLNLGTGRGYSVLQIIRSCERVMNKKVKYKIVDKREGDPPILVAESKKAKDELKWKPLYQDIDKIIESSWKFHKYYE